MKRMVIKGSEWLRGQVGVNAGLSRLLNDEGERCCIGIHARLCGVPDSHIVELDCVMNMHVPDITECLLPWVQLPDETDDCVDDSILAAKAMTINDSHSTSDDEKIAKLRPIFEEIGISIVWRPDL